MKWLDRWFVRKWHQAWRNRDEITLDDMCEVSTGIRKPRRLGRDEEPMDWEDGLRINIKRVIGGTVVTFRTYDRRMDQSESRHYIITDEQDFNSELGRIITMESVRQI